MTVASPLTTRHSARRLRGPAVTVVSLAGGALVWEVIGRASQKTSFVGFWPTMRALDDARARGPLPRRRRRAARAQGPKSTVHVKVTSVGDLNEQAQSVKSGPSWVISEPEHVGGLADAPTPLEYLLSGAVGCLAAVFAFYAAKHDVLYDTFEATALAELDVSGHMIEEAAPSGFRKVTLERIHRLALKGCPGIATLRDPVEIESSLEIQEVAAWRA